MKRVDKMSTLICEECRVGRYQQTQTPYVYWAGKQMLVFPNAPAGVCDVCKHTVYDSHFLNSMEYLLDDLTEQARNRASVKIKSMREKPNRWASTRSGQ